MLLKRFDKACVFSWSSAGIERLLLANGTPAHQMDSSFNTSSVLDLCEVQLGVYDQDLPVVGTSAAAYRFRKIIWSSEDASEENGIIITGADEDSSHNDGQSMLFRIAHLNRLCLGVLSLYNADKLLKSDKAALVYQIKAHAGALRGLDTNKVKKNLFASGAADSEVYVWDLNKPNSPMSAGQKVQPTENVNCVGFNFEVEHILGSLHSSKGLIWDLRKGDTPIIRVGDSGPKAQWSDMCWSPIEATSLCLASEDDHFSVVQHFDLRYASAPLLQMEGHQRGILSMSWSVADPNLLVTCGKDNKIYIWNPYTGEFLAEVPYNGRQWPFEVSWCPRNPYLLACSSMDGNVSIHSIVGGSFNTPMQLHSPKIADSFPGTDFSHYHHPAAFQAAFSEKPVLLPSPPKWMRRPVGASFCFGGMLVSFDSQKPPQTTVDANGQQQWLNEDRVIYLDRVSTEPQFCDAAVSLQKSLASGNLVEYCDAKLAEVKDDFELNLWTVVKASFAKDKRDAVLEAIGFHSETAAGLNKVARLPGFDTVTAPGYSHFALQVRGQTGMNGYAGSPNEDAEEENLSAGMDSVSLQQRESVDVLASSKSPLVFSNEKKDEKLLCQAIVSGQFDAAIELSIQQDRWTDAVLLAVLGGDEFLLTKTSRKYLSKHQNAVSTLISMMFRHTWSDLVETIDLRNWSDGLVALLTHANSEERIKLVEQLGRRLETEQNGRFHNCAALCYAAIGLVDNFSASLAKLQTYNPKDSLAGLQKLVELSYVLLAGIISNSRRIVDVGPFTSSLFCQYASALAAQGRTEIALECMNMLPEMNDTHFVELKQRLSGACGLAVHQKVAATSSIHHQPAAVGPAGRRASVHYPPQPQQSYGMNSPGRQQPDYSHLQSPPQPKAFIPTAPVPSSAYHQPAFVPGPSPGMYAPPVQPPPPTALQTGPMTMGAQRAHLQHPPTSAFGGGESWQQQQQQAAPVAVVPPTLAPRQSRLPSASEAQSQMLKMQPQPPAPQSAAYYQPPPPMSQISSAPPSFQQSAPRGIEAKPEVAAAASAVSYTLSPECENIRQTLNSLINGCIQKAQDMHSRKKLEEALHKLETELYPLLGQRKLSQSAVNGLQEIVRCVLARDYHSALAIYNQIIQGSDFSQLISFISSVKVALQFSQKLAVYL